MGKEKKNQGEQEAAVEQALPATEGEYAKMVREREAAGQGEHMNVTIISWDQVGQEVIGVFMSSEVMPETKYGTPVQRYLIKTDLGMMSCLLGAHADKEVLPKLQGGDLVRIVYNGQKNLGAGRSVNIFDVRSYGKAK